MSNPLARMAVSAAMFIHFTDVETGAKVYEQKTTEGPEGLQEVDDLDKPVGVRAYGPGSTQYRNAEAAVATAQLKAGRKTLTGDKLFDNVTEVMARTVFQYVGFDYNGQTINGADRDTALALNRKLLSDPVYAAVRDQISEKQGDLGNFSNGATST